MTVINRLKCIFDTSAKRDSLIQQVLDFREADAQSMEEFYKFSANVQKVIAYMNRQNDKVPGDFLISIANNTAGLEGRNGYFDHGATAAIHRTILLLSWLHHAGNCSPEGGRVWREIADLFKKSLVQGLQYDRPYQVKSQEWVDFRAQVHEIYDDGLRSTLSANIEDSCNNRKHITPLRFAITEACLEFLEGLSEESFKNANRKPTIRMAIRLAYKMEVRDVQQQEKITNFAMRAINGRLDATGAFEMLKIAINTDNKEMQRDLGRLARPLTVPYGVKL